MIYKIIASGSSGNALLLADKVLIDCGVPYKRLKGERFSLVLLTHEHRDHFMEATVRRLSNERPMLRFAAPAYLVPLLWKAEVKDNRIDLVTTEKLLRYKDITVQAFDLEHDVPNVGYITNIGGETAFYATDTGYLSHLHQDMSGLDYYFIEANYNAERLYQSEKAKLDAGEYAYESRVRQTHLSDDQAVDFLKKNARPDSVIEYMHRHAIEEQDE